MTLMNGLTLRQRLRHSHGVLHWAIYVSVQYLAARIDWIAVVVIAPLTETIVVLEREADAVDALMT